MTQESPTTPDWLRIRRGDAPVLLSLPHTGTLLPPEIADGRLVSRARALRDTDWYIEAVYDFAAALGIGSIRTLVSRTVIDVNRDPSGASLYPGQATTGLCPTETFDGAPLYVEGRAPDAAEVAVRRARWFDPYHAALGAELDRLRSQHGRVVLYDCHSIRSHVPRLFEGELPQFNIGTNDGRAASAELTARIEAIAAASGRSHVTNGRFKGGWITRHFGRPDAGIEAVQMELACRGYMREGADDEPAAYDPAYAAPLKLILGEMFQSILAHVIR